MSLFFEIIDRMIVATKARDQQEMLKLCGFASGLASKWKIRGNVSDKGIARCAEVTGVTFHWLKTGEGEMFQTKDPPTPVSTIGSKTKAQRLLHAFALLDEERQERLIAMAEDMGTALLRGSDQEGKGRGRNCAGSKKI